MDVLLTRPVVVALAVVGAALSTVGSYLQTRGKVSLRSGRALNLAGYVCMGISMLTFALAGLLT